MSLNLLLVFSLAMMTAVIGNTSTGSSGLANSACLVLLLSFVLLTAFQGVRKPVV